MDHENTPPRFRNTAKSQHLHQDIIEEILSRLPVKSLLRLRCVSKSWRCLIGSNRFIKAQLEKSRNYQNYARWQTIFNYNSENPVPGLKRCSKLSYLNDPFVDPSPIDDPTNNHLLMATLWNPATRISIELPKLDLEIIKYGFGWDEQSDAYKVFAVLCSHVENEWIGNVYSSKTNSWKTVEHGSLDLDYEDGDYLCGKIHWVASENYIESFDLKSEMFGMIELPVKPEVGVRPWLESLLEEEEERGGRLRVVYEYTDNGTRIVWEIKKYGVKESWVKVSVGGPFPSYNASTSLLWEFDDEGVLEIFPSEIVGCDQTSFYIESLVPPIW
ncbi:F-box protein At1g52495-like [Salvia miltiorrhiza]|uniref:F-box protein At1g52495-like n=1 Tax=Salvia miltiorrhiza TaxID=226208 RepID=UPI0025ACF7EC|nr:F-box protein At1g52495-like [Salvia miltiorrhiza]